MWEEKEIQKTDENINYKLNHHINIAKIAFVKNRKKKILTFGTFLISIQSSV